MKEKNSILAQSIGVDSESIVAIDRSIDIAFEQTDAAYFECACAKTHQNHHPSSHRSDERHTRSHDLSILSTVSRILRRPNSFETLFYNFVLRILTKSAKKREQSFLDLLFKR